MSKSYEWNVRDYHRLIRILNNYQDNRGEPLNELRLRKFDEHMSLIEHALIYNPEMVSPRFMERIQTLRDLRQA